METGEQLERKSVGHGLRVLLIEHGDAAAVAFHAVLSDRQLPVEFQRARNGDEATAMLRLQQHCGRTEQLLILLDLDLPDGADLALVDQLRRATQLCDCAVVGFSEADLARRQELEAGLGGLTCLHAHGPSEGPPEAGVAQVLVEFVESHLHQRV